MIIVSNESVNLNALKSKFNAIQTMNYDDFERQAFGDEGLPLDDGDIVYININNINQEAFEACKTVEDFKYFSLNQTCPSFVNISVEDWSFLNQKPSMVEPSIGISSGVVDHSDIDIRESSVDQIDESEIARLLNDVDTEDGPMEEMDHEVKDARIIVFGSSKGGTGKTFTSIISTYRYAKTHPNERIALIDFDIIDGQVGVSIHRVKPTVKRYYTEYQKGYRDFQTMRKFAVKANKIFPQNVDFYLAPSDGELKDNFDFWQNIVHNAMENYDVVVFDTGIDYLNIQAISYVYGIADKVNIVTTTSIKSVNSVVKQISKLKGELRSKAFSKDDDIGSKLNVIITQMVDSNEMNRTIYNTLSDKANVIATFGVITDSVSQAEYYGFWNVFDKRPEINKTLDNIMK